MGEFVFVGRIFFWQCTFGKREFSLCSGGDCTDFGGADRGGDDKKQEKVVLFLINLVVDANINKLDNLVVDDLVNNPNVIGYGKGAIIFHLTLK